MSENNSNNIYTLAGQIAIIFAVPVLIAVFVGTKLDAEHLSGKKYTLIFLAIAFALSWTLFIRKYLKITKNKQK